MTDTPGAIRTPPSSGCPPPRRRPSRRPRRALHRAAVDPHARAHARARGADRPPVLERPLGRLPGGRRRRPVRRRSTGSTSWAPLGSREPRLEAEADAQQVTVGRARLQHLRGELRALPRRERRGRHRPGAQPPGQAVRPPQRGLPPQRAHRRRPLRLRQPEVADAGLVEHGQPARTAELQPDRGPHRVHPGDERPDLHRSAIPTLLEPNIDPVTGKVETFKGWRDPNYKPAPGATPYPACWTDEFASGDASGSASRRPARRAGRPGSARARPAPAPRRRRSSTSRPEHRLRPRPTSRRRPAQPFTIHFDNQDAGTPHNVEIKDATGAEVFKGDIFPGVGDAATTGAARSQAGTYTFVCSRPPEHDRHPDGRS